MAKDEGLRKEKRHGKGTKEGDINDRHDNKKSKRRVEESSDDVAGDSESSTESEESSFEDHDRGKSRKISKRRYSDSSESESSGDEGGEKKKSRKRSKSSRRRYTDASDSESESSESESERRRRKRRERKRKEEKRRRRDKDKKKRRKVDDSDDGERSKKRKKEKKRKEKEKRGKTGAVTNSWGKFGVVREVDMWNKRPEFTAWLLEVKQVNLESLPNRDEKTMFKEYMEDYNTATFPSKKYYDLDAYHRRKMEKQMKKGFKKVTKTERVVFDDEEQRRQELLQAREKQKEKEVVALKDAMKSGMAQAMKEQVRLKEEMVYLYKIGNDEAAAAIQRKLDPDVPM